MRKNGKADGRETKTVFLTLKGLFKLILDGALSNTDIQLLTDKLFSKISFRKSKLLNLNIMKNIHIDTYREGFNTLRPKINLKYYNEDYAKTLFLNTISPLFLTKLINNIPNINKIPSVQTPKFRSDCRKYLKTITAEEKEAFFTMYASLQEQKKDADGKLALLTPVAKYIRAMNDDVNNGKGK